MSLKFSASTFMENAEANYMKSLRVQSNTLKTHYSKWRRRISSKRLKRPTHWDSNFWKHSQHKNPQCQWLRRVNNWIRNNKKRWGEGDRGRQVHPYKRWFKRATIDWSKPRLKSQKLRLKNLCHRLLRPKMKSQQLLLEVQMDRERKTAKERTNIDKGSKS